MADGPAGPGAGPSFGFDNSYARDLPGFSVTWAAARVTAPRLFRLNRPLAEDLGLDADLLEGPLGAEIFSGNLAPADARPVAQAYAGHQFGGFSPQLGDGRALLLGELVPQLRRALLGLSDERADPAVDLHLAASLGDFLPLFLRLSGT